MKSTTTDRVCVHCHLLRGERPKRESRSWPSRLVSVASSGWPSSLSRQLSILFPLCRWWRSQDDGVDCSIELAVSSGHQSRLDRMINRRGCGSLSTIPAVGPEPDSTLCSFEGYGYDPATFPNLNIRDGDINLGGGDAFGGRSTVSSAPTIPSTRQSIHFQPLPSCEPLVCVATSTVVFTHRVITLIALIPVTLTLLGIALFPTAQSTNMSFDASGASILTGLLFGKIPFQANEQVGPVTMMTLSDVLDAAYSVQSYMHRSIMVVVLMHTFVHAQRYFGDVVGIERNYQPGCRRRLFRKFMLAREVFLSISWIGLAFLASVVAGWDVVSGFVDVDGDWFDTTANALSPPQAPGLPSLPEFPDFDSGVEDPLEMLSRSLVKGLMSRSAGVGAAWGGRRTGLRPAPFSGDLLLAMLLLAVLSLISAGLEGFLLVKGIDLVLDPRANKWRLSEAVTRQRVDWGREWEVRNRRRDANGCERRSGRGRCGGESCDGDVPGGCSYGDMESVEVCDRGLAGSGSDGYSESCGAGPDQFGSEVLSCGSSVEV